MTSLSTLAQARGQDAVMTVVSRSLALRAWKVAAGGSVAAGPVLSRTRSGTCVVVTDRNVICPQCTVSPSVRMVDANGAVCGDVVCCVTSHCVVPCVAFWSVLTRRRLLATDEH